MKKFLLFFISFSMVLGLSFSSADALKITLKRVVFEGAKRSEVLTLINSADRPMTYRIGWRHYIMTEEESLVHIKDGEPLPLAIKPVTDMVRYAPRRVTIPPRSSQQIRLMLRTPAGLADGEYRSHLWIRPEEDVERFRKEVARDSEKTGRKTGVTVRLLTGVTMPVIVRKGALSVTAQVTNLVASQTEGFVNTSFYIAREGSRSVYGDLDFVCNDGGYLLHSAKGIALYEEVKGRKFNMKIEREADQPACKNLTVQYYETDSFLGKERTLLSEAKVSL